MRKTKALITGITGMVGSHLADFLLSETDWDIYGMCRWRSPLDNVSHLLQLANSGSRLNFLTADLNDYISLMNVVEKVKPDFVYHLAAQSYVSYSFQDEFSTLNTNINGTHYVLSAIKDFSPKSKFYFAASSEMFGKVRSSPQNEETPFYPRSAYGISKVTGFELTRNYREAYKLYAASGILFNHESPRRGFEFVTRKISHGVARIKFGLQSNIKLGNIDAKRDWGHAKDYVKAMWLMLQQKKPSDYVIGTGKMHSVKEFAKLAFNHIGLDYRKYIVIKKNLLRPSEVETLQADYTKAKKELKWEPDVSFEKLVKDMVESDINFVSKSGY